MKSFPGKFPSARGWALLLALFLGAGMFAAACGEEDAPAPTTPAPTPPPAPAPPPEPEPTGPAVPANLKATGKTSNSITWTWDAVEDVLGYQGQFSPDATFDDTDPTFLIVAPKTSHTVSNLSSNTTGYFRVRSGAGTSLTDLTYSDWAEAVSGTTGDPLPAVALSVPSGVSTGSAQDDTIVVSWDEVDDAETYEVEQRVAGGDWTDASCGAGDNFVETTECIATGLSAGTDYEFRVRAVPASADTDKYQASAWSDALAARTSVRAPADPVTGGMGALNVRWESTATSIAWIWDRVEGAEYDIYAAVQENGYNSAANPCTGKFDGDNVTQNSSRTSIDVTTTAGQVALLCVKTENPQNASENLSFAWAVASPAAFEPQTPNTRVKDSVTTALLWQGFEAKGGFNYEYNVVADPEGSSRISSGSTVGAVQNACSNGISLKRDETDVNFTDDNIVLDRSLKPFTGYLLCTRFSNDAGTSAWSVPGENLEIHTRPGKPPSPTVYSSLVTETADNTTVVWRVATRDRDEVPRLNGPYTVKTLQHRERQRNDQNTSTTTLKTPKVANCADTTGFSEGSATKKDDGEGIVITSGDFTRPPADPATADQNANQELGNLRVYLCVQASGTGGAGPWTLSSSYTVKKKPAATQ